MTYLGDRSQFLDLEWRAYLAHAAVSPPPFVARAAVASLLTAYARKGAGVFASAIEQRQQVRAKIATLIGAQTDEIAFVPSTTAGVRDVALSFPWKRGDRIVLFAGEFPANVTPWQRAAELFELEVAMLDLAPFLRDPDEGVATLRPHLERGVRLIALSAVQFQTGLRMPIQAIAEKAHAAGAQVFVDGIQAVGAIPIDVKALGVDYLACGGHKWLMGLEGAGFLFVDRARELVPRTAGWLSHENALDFLFMGEGHLRYDRPFKRTPDIVEVGAQSAVGYAALGASLDLLGSITQAAIMRHVRGYLDRLESELRARKFAIAGAAYDAGRSTILSVTPPEGVDLGALHRDLGERGVATSTPDGYLRFAPHFANHADEIPIVVAAVDDALSRLA